MESLKGTRDFFPAEMRFRRWLEGRWRSVAESYGYEEVDGPVLEPLELYTRKSGDEIVRQLYRLTDQGRRELALRPEMTPSLARMLLVKGGSLARPIRWYSIPRLFRYEKPQRGRLREFFQLNMDLFGVEDESADAELICGAADVLRAVGLTDADFRIYVNDRRLVDAILESEGVAPASRPAVLAAIDKLERGDEVPRLSRSERSDPADGVSLSAGGRHAQATATAHAAVLDLFRREPGELVESYPAGSAVRAAYRPLERLRALVQAGGAGGVVETRLRIVRGLAYYTGIVFEIYATGGRLRAICGGGRYDDLVGSLGGATLPAAGFGLGDAVLEELLTELGRRPELHRELDLYVIPATADDLPAAVAAAERCRRGGLRVETGLRRQAVGKQLGRAAAAGARFSVVVGERERDTRLYTPRDLMRGVDLPPVPEDELPRVLMSLRSGTDDHPPGTGELR